MAELKVQNCCQINTMMISSSSFLVLILVSTQNACTTICNLMISQTTKWEFWIDSRKIWLKGKKYLTRRTRSATIISGIISKHKALREGRTTSRRCSSLQAQERWIPPNSLCLISMVKMRRVERPGRWEPPPTELLRSQWPTVTIIIQMTHSSKLWVGLIIW